MPINKSYTELNHVNAHKHNISKHLSDSFSKLMVIDCLPQALKPNRTDNRHIHIYNKFHILNF